MSTPRARLALIPVAAAALALSITGCNDNAAGSSDASGSGSSASPAASSSSSSDSPSAAASTPAGTSSSGPAKGATPSAATSAGGQGGGATAPAASGAKAPCVQGGTTLVGLLDSDAYPDKITDPDHTGTKMTVQWGNKDGSFSSPVSMSSLIGVRKGEVGAVAIADFRNRGRLDALVNIVTPADGDDINDPRLSEFRPGPLNRSGLTSSQTTKSDISNQGEIEAMQIANYNGDAFPDVSIRHNDGDGMQKRDVRLSMPGGGLGDEEHSPSGKNGAFTDEAHPPALPTDGWSHFYKACG